MIKDSNLMTLDEVLEYKKMKLEEIRNNKDLLFILNDIIQDNIKDSIDSNPTINNVDIVIKDHYWAEIDPEFIVYILKDEYGYKGAKIISDGIKSPVLRIPLSK
jgi:hypothetical protein